MRELTDRQKEIFDFILASVREQGFIPSMREICEAFGFSSTNAVNTHLDALAKKGYISRRPGKARSFELAPDFLMPERGVPIVGSVAAGSPIDALENLEGYLDLDVMYETSTHYALRIVGDSMIDAGFWEGDYAIVHKQPTVRTGEIGVAILDEQATVKRFRWLEDGELELVPANEKYQPFRIEPGQDFRIGGKVVGLHRMLRS